MIFQLPPLISNGVSARVTYVNECVFIYRTYHIMSHDGLQFYWVRSDVSLWRHLWLPLSVHNWSHSSTQPMHEMRDRPQHRKLNALLKQVTEQCAKANKLLGFVRRASRYIQSTLTRRTLYLSTVRCHLGYATQVWSPQSIGLLKRVENVQRRATKLILKLPFRCDVTYKTRLQLTNLLPISYWHEFLDIVFFYKAVNNLVSIDCEALPASRQLTRSTRSSSSNAITYIPKRCRTVTYQCSFFIRACHTWNVLPAELRISHISLASFKRSLLQYYNKALDLYDVDDIRTWRTICPRCNIARSLLGPPTCCF